MNPSEPCTEKTVQEMPESTSSAPQSVGQVVQAILTQLEFLLSLLKESVQTRLSLFDLERKEWSEVLFKKLVTGGLFVFFLFLLMVSFNILIVIYFWDTYRVQAALGVFLFLLFALVVLAISFARTGAHFIPFHETLQQLRKDMGKEDVP